MRTRRSPTHQQQLWTSLGQEGCSPVPPAPSALDVAQACLDQEKARKRVKDITYWQRAVQREKIKALTRALRREKGMTAVTISYQ